jgi:hypothetical protein
MAGSVLRVTFPDVPALFAVRPKIFPVLLRRKLPANRLNWRRDMQVKGAACLRN